MEITAVSISVLYALVVIALAVFIWLYKSGF